MFIRFMFLVGVIGISAATGILADQIYFWIQDGTWYTYSMNDCFGSIGWRAPRVRIFGIQKITDGALDLPLSLVLFVLGVLLSGIAFDAGEPDDTEATEAALRRLRDYSR